ncbi:MAG: FKBP-type peptidyl-prolyl cis-trans isomerase [Cytophagales bacterium]|nr:FKBP-type peptidyl-prolyl cis-trans isomerase [Cytophagales bacterium]
MAKRGQQHKSRGSVGNNRKTGAGFMEKNGQKDGVITTESGLQYKVLEEGTGDLPFEDCSVIIHQRCALLSGKVIEDTYRNNAPNEVPLNELIEGYREGIMLMKKGGKSRFFIPPDLAWGKKGSGNKIPPNAVLIFDVRLVDFW